MRLIELKKRSIFSLIAIFLCLMLLYSENNYFNISGYINTQINIVKEKEMKNVYWERSSLGDRNIEGSKNDNMGSVKFEPDDRAITGQTDNVNIQQTNMYLQNQYISSFSDSDFLDVIVQYQNISRELEAQIDKDSYRDKKFDIYYVFNYNYTMNALKELDSVIDTVSKAQKVPKSLLTAVLFREMMFLGQEDLLDGLPFIGGKSIGICQIGIDNARYNEKVVHGDDSLIADDSDDEIKEMLQNPKQAVYFCAVQLRARAIKLTDDADVDLNELDEDQLHKVLAEYNQSKIKINIGPIKTKSKYAEETYKYYELFSELYKLDEVNN